MPCGKKSVVVGPENANLAARPDTVSAGTSVVVLSHIKIAAALIGFVSPSFMLRLAVLWPRLGAGVVQRSFPRDPDFDTRRSGWLAVVADSLEQGRVLNRRTGIYNTYRKPWPWLGIESQEALTIIHPGTPKLPRLNTAVL